jgi:hypothetical protein
MVDQELEIPIVYDTFLAQKVHYLNKQWLIDSDRYGGLHDRIMMCDAVQNNAVIL